VLQNVSQAHARTLHTYIHTYIHTYEGRLNWILCSAWKKWIGGTPLEHPPYSPDIVPYDFWTFPTMKRELQGKKFRSDQRYASRFREVGGAL
jgi:hypothetical protein